MILHDNRLKEGIIEFDTSSKHFSLQYNGCLLAQPRSLIDSSFVSGILGWHIHIQVSFFCASNEPKQ
jgi:hypothetical protein